MADRPLLTALFRDREAAEQAYQGVIRRGYDPKDIDVMMSDETRRQHFGSADTADTALGNKASEGAGVGAGIGGALGAVAAAIAAIGTSIAIPGLGLVVAGPLAAGLVGAGAGAAAGGLLGALVGWGLPEDRARTYEAGLREGGIVMGVRPRTDEDIEHLENHWRTARGESIYR